jgi:hypothetical protein
MKTLYSLKFCLILFMIIILLNITSAVASTTYTKNIIIEDSEVITSGNIGGTELKGVFQIKLTSLESSLL